MIERKKVIQQKETRRPAVAKAMVSRKPAASTGDTNL